MERFWEIPKTPLKNSHLHQNPQHKGFVDVNVNAAVGVPKYLGDVFRTNPSMATDCGCIDRHAKPTSSFARKIRAV